jgi:hypothetical protein
MPTATKQKPALHAVPAGGGGEVAAPKRKRGNPEWVKGMKKRAGRVEGTPNKFTKQAEDILIAAAAACGKDGKGKGDFIGYLSETARLHRPEYLAALMKLCPDRLVVRVDHRGTQVVQLREIYAELQNAKTPREGQNSYMKLIEARPNPVED